MKTSRPVFARLNEWLDHQPLLGILEKLGRLSVAVAVVSFLATFQSERESTRKATQYQAWQAINSAAGLSGDGGRSAALQDLSADHVSLAGVNLAHATLPGLTLERTCLQRAVLSSATLRAANLSGSDFSGAEVEGVDLTDADLSYSILRLTLGRPFAGAAAPPTQTAAPPPRPTSFQRANLQHANLVGADLQRAVLRYADLRGADLQGANLRDANIESADLRDARGLTCPQLQAARAWDTAFRDPGLSCGKPLPAARPRREMPMLEKRAAVSPCPDNPRESAEKRRRGHGPPPARP